MRGCLVICGTGACDINAAAFAPFGEDLAVLRLAFAASRPLSLAAWQIPRNGPITIGATPSQWWAAIESPH